ncbi:ATP-binding protein [Chitinophaga agrisoli]|nr:ATP-binding protein [Chitinophaga agrisoli]
MDLLKTRHREAVFLDACLTSQQPFVVDNTNPCKADRQPYITRAKAHRFKVTGYYFQSVLTAALDRNSQRTGPALVPEIGVRGTYNRLELPDMEEGFDELYYVAIENNTFIIQPWNREI